MSKTTNHNAQKQLESFNNLQDSMGNELSKIETFKTLESEEQVCPSKFVNFFKRDSNS